MKAGKFSTSIANRFHSEFGILKDLDLPDAVLSQPRRRTADRRQGRSRRVSCRHPYGFDRLPFAIMTIDPPAAWNSDT